MNQTHLHLLINHLPVFGSMLGSLVLVHGLWTKNNQTKIAAYNVLILSSVGALIAYLTGEAAEETVENIQGVAKNMIDAHEDMANFAFASFIGLGILSIAGIFFTLRKSAVTRSIALFTLLVSLISFGLVAKTAYDGGQIRHTEINAAVNTQQSGQEDND